MFYSELEAQAEAIVKKQQVEYATDKLVTLIGSINQQRMVVDKSEKILSDMEDNLQDLLTHKVGYPSVRLKNPDPYSKP